MNLPDIAERYSRQILFPAIGESGQQKLLSSRVAIVGCGALGSFQAGALARAGVGTLVLIDRDYLEWSNLQRQWLYEEAGAEQSLPKAIAASQALGRINSGISAIPLAIDLTPENIDEILEGCDLILDGADNFETRYLINDWAVKRGIPWIHGAAVGSYGLCMAIVPGRTGCLKCVYPEPPSGAQPTCETAGVLGAITSLVASLQCAEAMRLLCTGASSGKLTRADVWTGEIRQLNTPARDPDCQSCGRRDFIHLDPRRSAPISLCGRDAVQIHERNRPIDLKELAARLELVGPVRVNELALRFDAPPYRLTVFADGRVIVKGSTDVGVARGVYARYIGA